MRLIAALISLFVVAGQPKRCTAVPTTPMPSRCWTTIASRCGSVACEGSRRAPRHNLRHHRYLHRVWRPVITEVDGSTRAVTNAAGGIVWQFKGLTHIEEGTSERPRRGDDRPERGRPVGHTVKPAGAPAFSAAPRVARQRTRRRLGLRRNRGADPPQHIRDRSWSGPDGGEGRAISCPPAQSTRRNPSAPAANATFSN